MHIKWTLKLAVLFKVTLMMRSQVTLEFCTMHCGQTSSINSGKSSYKQFLPGKRGPVGAKGEKGDPAEQCKCQLMSDLQLTIDLLKRALSPHSCEDVPPRYENDAGGVYTIYPFSGGRSGIQVYCDLIADDGGWLVIQKRIDGSENFYRNWSDYVNGFGKVDGEYWLGLTLIYELTKNGEYELRIDLEDFDGNIRYASYRKFVIGGGMNYTLSIDEYSGDAGDGFSSVNGARFSTYDRDQDTNSASCSQTFKGGWWYLACHNANPNGLYLGGSHDSYADGIEWKPWLGYHYSLKRIEMKLRKK